VLRASTSVPAGETWTTHPSAVCPDCEYRLGSAWLYEALPDDILDQIDAAAKEPADAQSH
jgi:hypothetical protein